MSPKHRQAYLTIASVTVVLFVWAIAIFWFGQPVLSPAALRVNAIIFICIWTLGPAVWFIIEGQVWKSEPGLIQGQQYARDFWIGTGALVLILAARELSGGQAQPLVRYTVAWNLVIDAIRIIVWPTVAIFGFFLFREPVSAFFAALGTRASKIGAFNVSIELTSLPEAQPWSGPALEDLRSEYPTAAADSSSSLFKAIADTTHADYVTVNLEGGEAWLTSRLFILATLIPRVRPIKRIVFLIDPAEKFVGESIPADIAEALAKKYSWLEEAYIAAHVYVLKQADIHLQQGNTLLGRLDPNDAGRILSDFLSRVKGIASSTEWVDFGSYAEHAEWVTSASLLKLLGRKLNLNAVKRDPSVDDLAVTRTILRHDSSYVAIVDGFDRFQRLIDRNIALDQVVRQEMAKTR